MKDYRTRLTDFKSIFKIQIDLLVEQRNQSTRKNHPANKQQNRLALEDTAGFHPLDPIRERINDEM